MGYSANSFGTPTQAKSITSTATNATGSTIPFFTPIRVNSTGMHAIDVSDENDVFNIAGITTGSVINGNTGTYASSGKLAAVPVAYADRDPVYISKSGGVTNSKPDIGVAGFVAGDWVVRLGFISINESNPSQRDFLVNIVVVGQLA